MGSPMSSGETELEVRCYGASGPLVIVVHGGPGAPGCAQGLAWPLMQRFRVLEPFQRRRCDQPLTVAIHIADLAALIADQQEQRPALVGHSWGAMLVLALAAAHPELVGPLVLVGCGTFDEQARSVFHQTTAERLGPEGRARLASLEEDYPDEEECFAALGALYGAVYEYDAEPSPTNPEPVDCLGGEETWHDMLRLQAEGLYPQSFSAITSPVLMLHGDWDPHPGPLIRDGLKPYIPELEYLELPLCGHEPWRERQARETFFRLLQDWLEANCHPKGSLARLPLNDGKAPKP